MTDASSAVVQETQGDYDVLLAQTSTAIADDLLLLARLTDRELDCDVVRQLRSVPPSEWFSLSLEGDDIQEAFRLIDVAWKDFGEDVTEAALDDHAAEYAAIFLTHSYRAAPVESVWRDDEGLERQQAMFAVRDYYQRFGVTTPDWRCRSDDHITHELAFLAFLLKDAGRVEEWSVAGDFLKRHLLVWHRLFAGAIAQRCRLPFYAGVTLTMALYLDRLAVVIGEVAGMDMTPAELLFSTVSKLDKGEKGPTCGDPPSPRYMPGQAPSW